MKMLYNLCKYNYVLLHSYNFCIYFNKAIAYVGGGEKRKQNWS
jgi:hypothetical protein